MKCTACVTGGSLSLPGRWGAEWSLWDWDRQRADATYPVTDRIDRVVLHGRTKPTGQLIRQCALITLQCFIFNVWHLIDSSCRYPAVPCFRRSSADAEIPRQASRWTHGSQVQAPHSSIPHWSSSVEFRIDSGRFRLAGSQDTNLSCHVPVSTICCTVWSQSTNVTNRQTDGRHARSISATCAYRLLR